MASNYAGHAWTYETTAGIQLQVPAGIEVHVYNVTTEADVAESPLTTNADGEIEAGSFAAVAAGTEVRFRVENFEGMAFSVSQVTT